MVDKTEITLEKIDVIRQRFGVGYAEAKGALETVNGDLIQALVLLEQKKMTEPGWDDRLQEKGEEFVGQLKTLLHKGNITKIKLKKDEETLVEIPVNVGVLGVMGALASAPLAIIGAIGTVAAVVNKCTFEVERPEDAEKDQEPTEPQG